ncbi:MAG: glycoside hydrolase 5 family protein, partial [Candidatus Dormibacteria bacterium]
SVDSLHEEVRDYNPTQAARPARVVLEVGMRNMGYPELYVPSWIAADEQGDAQKLAHDGAYLQYLDASIARYRDDPLLYGWQLENEPLDNVATEAGSRVDLGADTLQEEIDELRAIDSTHRVVVTTFNSSTLSLDLAGTTAISGVGPKPAGHPAGALDLGDALGLDLYVATGGTSLADASAQKRTDWKLAALSYWSDAARARQKSLWITEMQGAPWPGRNDFTPANLVYAARRYRASSASVVLLWGVESWVSSPQWMAAGVQARRILGA